MSESTKNDVVRQEWAHKTGKLPFPMTNDYLFRALCQKDSLALRSLICSVLHWDDEQVMSAEVTNPILLGKAIDDKEFVLDVHVKLGDDISMNLEMQVINYRDWPERSLQYLCRQFDQLHQGDHYGESRTAIHVGILSFDPFEGRSRLRESYRILSLETNLLYTDKFQMYVLCLPQTDRHTEEDARYHTDAWADYFKAKTWEELKMAATKDTGIASAAATANKLWEDADIRARMQAREDFEWWERARAAKMRRLQEGLAEAEAKNIEDEAKIAAAETERAKAETERAKAEADKIMAENQRAKAENKYLKEKKKNEDLHIENENLQAEIERLRLELEKRE